MLVASSGRSCRVAQGFTNDASALLGPRFRPCLSPTPFADYLVPPDQTTQPASALSCDLRSVDAGMDGPLVQFPSFGVSDSDVIDLPHRSSLNEHGLPKLAQLPAGGPSDTSCPI